MEFTNAQNVNVILRTALSLPAVEPSTSNSLPAQVMEWQLSERIPPAMPASHHKATFLRTIAICMAISCWPEKMFSAQQRVDLMLRLLDKALLHTHRPLLDAFARNEQATQLLPFAMPRTTKTAGLPDSPGQLGHAVLLLMDLACEPEWFGVSWQRRQNTDFNLKARRLAHSIERATTNGGRVSHLVALLRELNWALKQSHIPTHQSTQVQEFVRANVWPLITGRDLSRR